MENNTNPDLFNDRPKVLPSTLNVLTILTFIGCGLGYCGLLYGITTWSHHEADLAKLQEQQDKLGDTGVGNFMKGSVELFQKNYENRYVLLISGLIFVTMCLIGAMQMRKLKKSGFSIYTIGELAPLVLSAALLGVGSLMASATLILGTIIALVFVILYASQRKYMVNP